MMEPGFRSRQVTRRSPVMMMMMVLMMVMIILMSLIKMKLKTLFTSLATAIIWNHGVEKGNFPWRFWNWELRIHDHDMI